MSRSYKKNPWFKDNGKMKKLFNRRFRRSKKYQDIPSGNAYKKCNETYDQCDFKFDCSWEEFQTWYWTQDMSKEEAWAEWKKSYGSK